MSETTPTLLSQPGLPDKTPAGGTTLYNILGRLIALFIVFAFFGILVKGGKFYSARNIENILRQSCVYGTAAMGMTLIIITAGIDLSAGSIIALAVVVTAWVLNLGHEVPGADGGPAKIQYLIYQYPNLLPILAIVVAVLAAMLAGMANGLMIVGLRLVPFIVTLGMMGIVRGLAKGIAEEKDIYPPEDTWLNSIMEPMINTPHAKSAIEALGVWSYLFLALVVLAWLYAIPRIPWNDLGNRLQEKIKRPRLLGTFCALWCRWLGILFGLLRPISNLLHRCGLWVVTFAVVAVNGCLLWQLVRTDRTWMAVAAGTLSVLCAVLVLLVSKSARQRLFRIALGLLLLGVAAQAYFVCNLGVRTLVVSLLAAGFVLRYTRFGRHVFAVGSNEETARLCGVPVGRTKITVYATAGFFFGLAGLMQFSFIDGIGSPTTGVMYELFIIASVIIGGASFAGGEGSVFGSLIGALIITILYAGGLQMGWPKWVQEMVIGGIIIAAVALDQFRHRRTT